MLQIGKTESMSQFADSINNIHLFINVISLWHNKWTEKNWENCYTEKCMYKYVYENPQIRIKEHKNNQQQQPSRNTNNDRPSFFSLCN